MWPSLPQNTTSQSQTLPDGTGSYGYHSGDGSMSNHKHQAHMPPAPTHGYQPMRQATWSQAGFEASNLQLHMRPSTLGNMNSPQLQAFSSNGPASYNNYCGDSSISSQRSYYSQGQRHPMPDRPMHSGSWHPGPYSTNFPSPVFRGETSKSQKNIWPSMSDNNTTIQSQSFPAKGAVSYSNHNVNGSLPNQNNQSQGPRASMQGHQPMQFNTPGQRPHFSGQFRGGFPPPNHRGGRGSRELSRGKVRHHRTVQRANWNNTEGKHFCDPCDRSFNSSELLAKHVSEHRVCGIDGCTLNAHTNVVDKHIQMQHDTGLFLKMKDLFSSDDFAKWRAERKRSYPSKVNIEKRQAEQEEKLKRGESLGNENERFPRNRGGKSQRGEARIRGGRGRNSRQRTTRAQSETGQNSFSKKNMGEEPIETEEVPTGPNCAAKTSFACIIDEEQIQDIPNKEEKDFSDTEWEPLPGCVDTAPLEAPKLSTALNCLATMYDSDSGEEASVTIKRQEEKMSSAQTEDDGQGCADGPLEVPICRSAPQNEDISDVESQNISNKRRHNHQQKRTEKPKRNKINNHGGYKQRQSVSLLQKLLSSEIRHERNVVLQCIRYIVENNFLQQMELTSEANLQRMELIPTNAQEIMRKEETEISPTLP